MNWLKWIQPLINTSTMYSGDNKNASSHMRQHSSRKMFGQGRWRGRACEWTFPYNAVFLITAQNSVTFSHTVRAHRGSREIYGGSGVFILGVTGDATLSSGGTQLIGYFRAELYRVCNRLYEIINT